MSPLHRFALPLLVATLPAAAQDAPPINAAEILAALRQLKATQVAQEKTAKQTAIQQATAGAGSGERAAALWEEAVRVTQFQGVAKENAAFREWKDREGEALKSKEAQNAARLFFTWLGLTLQRSNGTEVKTLLPAIINYTKEATVMEQTLEHLEESIKKEREAVPPGRRNMNTNAREKVADAQGIRRFVEQILKKPLGASPVAQWMKVGDFVAPEKWENHPGDVDGIFQKIVLPELRTQRDPRALEYWDIKLKREAEAASARRSEFEIATFNTVRRPELLWGRAEECIAIGQKNKGVSEMLALIKANPTHPDTGKWIGQLEELLAPPAAAPAVPPKQ